MGLFRFRVGAPEVPPDNLAPVWTVVPTLTVAYGVTTANVAQYVDDPEGGLMTYAKVGIWPSYLSLDTTTGVITATVDAVVGTVGELQVSATDAGNLTSTSAEFSVSIIKGTNRAPRWTSPLPPFTVTAGGTISAGTYATDFDGDDVDFVPVPPTVLPSGFSLDNETGQVSVNASTTAGTYSFRLRATDGSLTADSGNFVVTVNAATASPLAFEQLAYVKLDTIYPAAKFGVWSWAWFDKRGGLVMWGRSDHGDETGAEGGIHALRYYNDTPNTQFGIAPGDIGYLVQPQASQATAKIADYDNYPWYYVDSEDKLFWIERNDNDTSRNGIYDFQVGDWTYGNNGINSAQWPSGPYATHTNSSVSNVFIHAPTTTSLLTTPANMPGCYIEAADKIIITRRFTNPPTNRSVLIFERNPDYLIAGTATTNRPWRWRIVTVGTSATAPWAPHDNCVAENGDVMQRHNYNGVAVGVWFYIARPTSSSTYLSNPVPGSYTFWRVNVNDLTQYEQLADFPIHKRPLSDRPYSGYHPDWANDTLGSHGPLMVYDEDSNSIIALHDRLLVYDIDANTWTDRTFTGYNKVLGACGDIKRNALNPTIRDIVYYARAQLTGPDVTNSGTAANVTRTNVNPYTGASLTETGENNKWIHKLRLTGSKPRARFVPRSLRDNYGPAKGGGSFSPWIGKHLRLLYSRKWNNIDGSAGSGGYVWQFGGDMGNSAPFSQVQPTGYPDGTGTFYDKDSGRQDMWRAPVTEVSGTVQLEMSCNYVAFYPYPGPLDPATTQLGPPRPDGISVICDKRGDFWVGPGYSRGVDGTSGPPEFEDEFSETWRGNFRMYRFRLPAEYNGVRQGNGWYVPPQNYLLPNDVADINADDIQVGSSGMTGACTGVSNLWGAYDEKADELVILSRGGSSMFLYKFPCVPTSGRHVWTRTSISRSTSTWYTFLNTQLRGGATPYSASNPPATIYGGAHVVINDKLYVTTQVTGGDVGRRIAHLTVINLRDLAAEPEYIALPSGMVWVYGWDAPRLDGTYDGTSGSTNAIGSIPEYRDIQRLGHLIVVSPMYEWQRTSDPWLYWYNTNTGVWTAGQTYSQMQTLNSSIPNLPNLNKGGFCTVEETGEAWVNLGSEASASVDGIIKYRIL